MRRAAYKVEGGKLIKVQLEEKDGKVEKVKITGDFFLHPEDLIEEIERGLVGKALEEQSLASSIEALIKEKGATLLGASPRDIARCILMASEGGC